MLVRYSKPTGDIFGIKRALFDQNDDLQARLDRIAELYVRQPRRTRCKNCDTGLAGSHFVKKGVGYTICEVCGHLNGDHEDTDAFCAAVYTADEGADYAAAYLASGRQAYRERVASIYAPKAEFLFEGLRSVGRVPLDLRYADIGAGAGYFVSALRSAGADVQGFDVSAAQARFARAMDPAVEIITHDLASTADVVRQVESDVISLIGVLEHLQRPRDVLGAVRDNSRAEFLYLSLPLFSPSVVIESVFPQVMQRQLGGGHTHLYTEGSIRRFSEEFELTPVAEWWFGTDIMDLYRGVEIMLRKAGDTGGLLDYWRSAVGPAIDSLQAVLDQRRTASEVHVLFRKGR